MSERPLAIDLFTGVSGWGEGLIAAGWRVIGYDIEDMFSVVGVPKPEHFELVLQDVMTLHGSQFKDAELLVCSPPCQEFSWMAMPWSRAKQVARALRGEDEFPEGYRGSRTIEQLTALFDACFRIQRECNEARAAEGKPPIPMVVENVRGARPWVGRSEYHYGSFHLWGDVPALMPRPPRRSAAMKFNPDGTNHPPGSWFAIADSRDRGSKVPGFRFDGSGGSFQTASVEGMKNESGGSRFNQAPRGRAGEANNARDRITQDGLKHGGDWFSDPSSPSRQGGQVKVVAEGRKGAGAGAGAGAEWFDGNLCVKSSKSTARKAASAKIAKIPFRLSNWIGEVYFPKNWQPSVVPLVTAECPSSSQSSSRA